MNHKTVQRWIYEGRTPRLKRALTIAARFGVEPLWLWPTLARDRLPDGTGLEATALIYSRASAMPPAFLRHLAAAAERELWILTGSQWFLECLKPHEVLWADRQASAVTRRLLVSPSLSQQLSPFAVGAISVRTSRDVGSSSMVRADDAMVVVSGGVGLELPSSPVLYLSRASLGGAFDRYAEAFEGLWRSRRSQALGGS